MYKQQDEFQDSEEVKNFLDLLKALRWAAANDVITIPEGCELRDKAAEALRTLWKSKMEWVPDDYIDGWLQVQYQRAGVMTPLPPPDTTVTPDKVEAPLQN
jgi:hypothetical protein